MENFDFVQHGFAIGVTCFLLFRLERELKEVRNCLSHLRRCSVCKLGEERRKVTVNGN